MTKSSPIQSSGLPVFNRKKGSTYGSKQRCSSSNHSFQGHQRDGGSNNTYGVEVLSGQAVVRPLQQGTVVCEPTRDPTTA